MAIGELLKSYRKVSGFSVKETVQKLSERGIDVSEKTLYSWESGHRQPDADTFITLCLIYGVTSIPMHYTTCPSPMQPLIFLSPPHPSIRAVCFSTYSDSGRSSHVLSYKATASFACKLPHITVIKWSNSTHLK